MITFLKEEKDKNIPVTQLYSSVRICFASYYSSTFSSLKKTQAHVGLRPEFSSRKLPICRYHDQVFIFSSSSLVMLWLSKYYILPVITYLSSNTVFLQNIKSCCVNRQYLILNILTSFLFQLLAIFSFQLLFSENSPDLFHVLSLRRDCPNIFTSGNQR